MKVKSYSPHVAGDVKGIDFCYFVNADSISSPSMVSEGVVGNGNFEVTSSDIIEGKLLKYYWYTKTQREGYRDLSQLSSDWNAIALYKFVGSDKSYLSLIYWDSPISKTPMFETLTLSYNATSVIKAEGGGIDVDFDYTVHVTEDAKYLGVEKEGMDFYHPQFDGKVRKSRQTPPGNAQKYNSQDLEYKLNGISSVESEVTPSNWGTTSLSDSLIPRCLPNVSEGELGVSSNLGCYIYKVSSTKTEINFVKGKYNTPTLGEAFGDNKLIAPPIPEGSELYIIGREVLVAYKPETYEVYCSCLEGTSSEGYHFQDFWKVGNGEKIIIPSYFNIFPFAFYQDKEGNWKVMNYRAFKDDGVPTKTSEYRLKPDGSDWDSITYEEYRTVQAISSVTTDDYLKLCIYEELNLYTDAQKDRIVDYLKNQLYLSHTTFIQCLRFFPSYNIQMGDCGCICTKGDKVLFVPYSPLSEKSNQRKMTSVITLPNKSKVDNYLYYVGNKVGSILTGEEVTFPKRVSVRNGVVAQFTS